MSQFGQVAGVKILKKNGNSRGFGFVSFKSSSIAQQVITLQHSIEGQEVSLIQSPPLLFLV
jgi:RNA recognition motif-containing protein